MERLLLTIGDTKFFAKRIEAFMNDAVLTLNFSDGSSHDVPPDAALVFVDETGSEQLLDPIYPIFGLGGCCILAKDYYEIMAKPWSNIKRKYFKKSDQPLHATDITFESCHFEAYNNFFSSQNFGRFTVIASTNTTIEPPIDLIQTTIYSLYYRIIDILKWTTHNGIFLIFEDSDRLKPKLEKYSSEIHVFENVNGADVEININHCVMSKKTAFPGLEIADFIIHSAGTTCRDRINGKISKLCERKDFDAIFNNIDPKYTSFLNINSATFTPSKT